MRLYMINFHYPDSYSEAISTPPLGMGYLLEAVERRGIPLRYWEHSRPPRSKDLIDDIRAFAPTLIGCSFYSHYHRTTYAAIRELSVLGLPIVLGGVHVNARGAPVLEETGADFLIRGEGEESLVRLLERLGDPARYPEIPGLVYREDGEIRENPRRPLDLDTVEFPRYRGFELQRYPSPARLVLSSRGCPYRCTFCQQSALLSKTWRPRSAGSILRELEHWAAQGVTRFDFADDNFTFDRQRIVELCALIGKSRHCFRIMTSGVCINNVDADLLERLKDAGVYYLSFGIESGNDRVLKEIRKGITLAQIHRTLEQVCKLGFEVKLYFIINNRTETYQEVHDSFDLARQYPISLARFTNLVPYPGTYDHAWILEHGRLLFDPEVYLNRLDRYVSFPLYDGPGMRLDERRQVIVEARAELARYHTRVSWPDRFARGLRMIRRGELRRLAGALRRVLASR